MTDFASLGIKIDSSQAKQAAGDLDRLAVAGGRAEAATVGLSGGFKGAGVEAAAMASAAQLSARAAMDQAAGFGAATSAARLNTLAMRETLVVAREISRGNFTRLPGSLTLLAQGVGSQGGIGAYAAAIAQQLGLIKQVQNAELAEAAAAAANAAAGVEAAARKAAANVMAADTEIALAEAQVRVTAGTTAEAVAQVRLAAAHEAVGAAAAEAAVAEDALAVAMGRSAEAGAASAAATRTLIGGAGIGLLGIATVAGVAFGAFKEFQNQVRDDGTLTAYRDSLGLTHEEMLKLSDGVDTVGGHIKKLGDVTVTFGDVWHGVWSEVAKEANDGAPWNNMKNHAVTAFDAILTAWNNVSAGITAGIYTIQNLMAKGGGVALGIAPGSVPTVNGGELSLTKNFAKAKAENAALSAGIAAGAIQSAENRMRDEADALKADRKPKKAPGDHGNADALAELDAQIKGQLALAAAYQVSDAAAVKAEAMQKAEEAAIRHKGETGIFYEKELALAVATRAAAGAKEINQLSGQTAAQKAINDAVAAGTMTVAEANVALKDEAQIRPLQTALTVASEKASTSEGKAKAYWLGIVSQLTPEIARLTVEQKKANDEANRAQVLAATDQGQKQLDRLKLEATLIGASNVERAKAIALLEAQQFLDAHPSATAQGSPDYAAAQEHTRDYVRTQLDIAEQTANLATAQDNYNKSLSYTADLLSLINDQAQTTASGLADAFGGVGDGIGKALTALTSYQAAQARIEEERKAAVKAAGTGPSSYAAIANAEVIAAKKSGTAKQQATMQAIDGIKSLFNAHSKAYKVMQAVEQAYAVWQAAETIASMIRDALKTTSSVTNSGIRTTANTAEGGSKIFAELGPWAFPVVAAMVAVIAALGFSAAGGGGAGSGPTIPTAQDLQDQAGTGTVLGSPKDKSASIAHSLDLVAKNTNDDLQYSNQMLIALRSIDTSIGAMAASVAKQINVNGSLFDTSGLKIGSSGSGGFLGLFASSTTRSLFDAGITLAATTVGNIVASGIAGSTYQTVEQIKKNSGFLGIGGSTKTSYITTNGALPADITGAIQSVIGALENGLVTAAKIIGIDGAKAMIDGFQVDIGKISFNGLDAQGIEDELNAIFSSVGDKMAQALFPALASMQKVGEGLFETFTRVAKEYETVDVELRSIGRTFGAVGVNSITARDALVQLFGGLDDFVTATDAFRDKFLTQAEQIAPVQASVVAEMKRLGESGITTREQFKNLVLGLDLTTDAGRQMYASLLAVAPAFDKVLSYFDDLNKTTVDGLQQTIDQFNNFADTLKKYRDTLFDTGATQEATTAILKAKFNATAALAGNGDATALGNLQNDAKAYLDSAQLSAGSYLEYQRALAQVAAGVDKGIFAAESTADYAQLQLDALKNATTILQGIDANTAAMVDALQSPPVITSPVVIAAPPTGPDAPATQADIDALRTDINAGLTAIAISSGTTAKVLYNASNGDYLRIGNDPDTGLTVLP